MPFLTVTATEYGTEDVRVYRINPHQIEWFEEQKGVTHISTPTALYETEGDFSSNTIDQLARQYGYLMVTNAVCINPAMLVAAYTTDVPPPEETPEGMAADEIVKQLAESRLLLLEFVSGNVYEYVVSKDETIADDLMHTLENRS